MWPLPPQQESSGFWAACAENVAEAARLGASTKSAVLVSLLKRIREDAPGDRIVVVSNFKRTLVRLQGILSSLHLRICLLCGSTPAARRSEIVTSLNTSGPDAIDVLLLSSKAGGLGLNLIGANRLVLYDPDWNPANDAQAMARVWREGQRKEVFIYRFVLAGTLEEKICQRQHAKADLAAITIDGISNALSSVPRLSWEELRRVFELEGYSEDGMPLSASLMPSALFGEPFAACDEQLGNALLDSTELRDAVLSVHMVGRQSATGTCIDVSNVTVARPPATPQRARIVQDHVGSFVGAAGTNPAVACVPSTPGTACTPPQAVHSALSERLGFLTKFGRRGLNTELATKPASQVVLGQSLQPTQLRCSGSHISQIASPTSPKAGAWLCSLTAPKSTVPTRKRCLSPLGPHRAVECRTNKSRRSDPLLCTARPGASDPAMAPEAGPLSCGPGTTQPTPASEPDLVPKPCTHAATVSPPAATAVSPQTHTPTFQWSVPDHASGSLRRPIVSAVAPPSFSAPAFLWSKYQ